MTDSRRKAAAVPWRDREEEDERRGKGEGPLELLEERVARALLAPRYDGYLCLRLFEIKGD